MNHLSVFTAWKKIAAHIPSSWNAVTTQAAPWRFTICAWCSNPASPSFREIELTMHLPWHAFRPASTIWNCKIKNLSKVSCMCHERAELHYQGDLWFIFMTCIATMNQIVYCKCKHLSTYEVPVSCKGRSVELHYQGLSVFFYDIHCYNEPSNLLMSTKSWREAFHLLHSASIIESACIKLHITEKEFWSLRSSFKVWYQVL